MKTSTTIVLNIVDPKIPLLDLKSKDFQIWSIGSIFNICPALTIVGPKLFLLHSQIKSYSNYVDPS